MVDINYPHVSDPCYTPPQTTPATPLCVEAAVVETTRARITCTEAKPLANQYNVAIKAAIQMQQPSKFSDAVSKRLITKRLIRNTCRKVGEPISNYRLGQRCCEYAIFVFQFFMLGLP
jgi:hypothetical protein